MKTLLLAALLCRPAGAALIASMAADPLGPTRQAYEAGKYKEVVVRLSPEAMQRLSSDNMAKAYLLLGQAYERMDRPDLALGVYQLSTNIFPKDINLLSQLGLLLHHAGLEEQAQPIFEKLLSIHPHNAQAHLGLGEIDSALGLLDESAQHYEQALETLTNLPALWRDYSEVLYRKRDYKTAETAARKSLDLTPALETFVDLAFIQRGQGDTSGAIKTLDTALSRWPERQDASLLRATWLLEAGRFDEALPAAQAALAQDGAQPLALWIRARVELARGQKKEALTDLSLAAQASRTAPFVAKASEALLKELREARR